MTKLKQVKNTSADESALAAAFEPEPTRPASKAPKKKAPKQQDGPLDPYAEPAPADPYATPAAAPATPAAAPQAAPKPEPKPGKPDPKKDGKPVDPYAAPAKPDPKAPPAIPSRVGLSDLTAVQGLLAVQRLDRAGVVRRARLAAVRSRPPRHLLDVVRLRERER